MSVEDKNAVAVDIGAWVERAKADPVAYRERQATEIFLAALGMTKPFCHQVFLKGGILMGVVYGSPRQTGDIDFTTIIEPKPGIAEELAEAINANLPRAAAELGYPDLLCRIQSYRYFPKGDAFPKNEGPAVKLKVGYARRGSKQEERYQQGRASDALEIDISFKEPVGAIQVVHFDRHEIAFQAYSLLDLMAEKFRALLQQEVRNRYRRQDIYDLDALIARFDLDAEERKSLLTLLKEKSAARGISPVRDGLEQPETIRRAREAWDTQRVEVGDLPEFDECFGRVNAFYHTLPWSDG